MTPLLFTLLVFGAALGAGFCGAILGLGGGIIVIPVLRCCSTSISALPSGLRSSRSSPLRAAAAYVREHMTNLRAAMFLELGATTGALLAGRGAAIIMAGLLMLIATPVLRVGVSIFAFLLQEDWVFTIVTAVVFGLLILSFFLGRTGG